MNELKHHVERIVNPIAASEHRKDRFREELLLHLMSAADELHEQHEETEAVRLACERLGPVPELRRQLQSSVPGLERLLFLPVRRTRRLEEWLGDRLCELTPLAHALRVTLFVVALLLTLHLLLVVPVALLRDNLGAPFWRFAFSGYAFAASYMFVFTYGMRMLRRVLAGTRAVRRALQATAWTLASGLAIAGSAAALWQLSHGFPELMAFDAPPLLALLGIGVFSCAALLVCGLGDAADQRRRNTWGHVETAG